MNIDKLKRRLTAEVVSLLMNDVEQGASDACILVNSRISQCTIQ